MSQLVDRVLGVRTTFVESTGLFDKDDPILSFHKPTGWLTLHRVFRALDIGPDDVMVDFGSGSGRAVLVASLFPFRRVIGVEWQEALHRQAMDNLARLRPRRRASVEFVHSDALKYQLPDDVTVVFLYNPFDGKTFHQVMAGVFAAADRTRRRLRVVYVNPKEHAYLVATGRCRWVATVGGLRPTRAWSRMLATHIYEVGRPAAERSHPAEAEPVTRQRAPVQG